MLNALKFIKLIKWGFFFVVFLKTEMGTRKRGEGERQRREVRGSGAERDRKEKRGSKRMDREKLTNNAT